MKVKELRKIIKVLPRFVDNLYVGVKNTKTGEMILIDDVWDIAIITDDEKVEELKEKQKIIKKNKFF